MVIRRLVRRALHDPLVIDLELRDCSRREWWKTVERLDSESRPYRGFSGVFLSVEEFQFLIGVLHPFVIVVFDPLT